ncbi:MAG: PPOX class F420-dependent oxidoreductase [Chloroflexi bacterium]|nr:PPOX class F420-dependent oxidoreductase [Chloroflexota bacterium]
MNEQHARGFIARNHRGVLATIKRDGRPQLSHIAYALDHDGLLKISVTQDRAKTKNVRRDPRVTMTVESESWYEYVVVEGHAEIQDQDPIPDLRRIYEMIAGRPHPNWQEFDEAMVRDRRCILAIRIERIYPLTG